MYETNTNEYIVTIVDERGTHRLTMDDEDMAHLMNHDMDGEIVAEEPLTRPPELEEA